MIRRLVAHPTEPTAEFGVEGTKKEPNGIVCSLHKNYQFTRVHLWRSGAASSLIEEVARSFADARTVEGS